MTILTPFGTVRIGPKKTLEVPEFVLEAMLNQWPRPLYAEYRHPKCWGCGRTLWWKMWHVFFRKEEREAHLCWRCGKPFEIEI